MTPAISSPKGGHFRLFRDCFFFVCYFVQNAFLRQMNTFVPTLFPIPYECKQRITTFTAQPTVQKFGIFTVLLMDNGTRLRFRTPEVKRRQILFVNHYQEDDSLGSIPTCWKFPAGWHKIFNKYLTFYWILDIMLLKKGWQMALYFH